MQETQNGGHKHCREMPNETNISKNYSTKQEETIQYIPTLTSNSAYNTVHQITTLPKDQAK